MMRTVIAYFLRGLAQLLIVISFMLSTEAWQPQESAYGPAHWSFQSEVAQA